MGNPDLGWPSCRVELPREPAQKEAEARNSPLPCRAASTPRASCCLTPIAMKGLIRFFYPSRGSRSRITSAEKQLCARGTALWTHVRCLVCRGKVGQSGPGISQGAGRGGTTSQMCQTAALFNLSLNLT